MRIDSQFAKLIFACGAGALMGCASSTPERPNRIADKNAPRAEIAIEAGMPPEEAHQARKIYLMKCGKCHRFYEPTRYSDEEWEMWMSKMRVEAKLRPAQEDLLNRYIGAYRKLK